MKFLEWYILYSVVFQNQRCSNENQGTLSQLKSSVNQADRAEKEAQNKLSKVENELSYKNEEAKAANRELDAKKSEMNRLGNVKNIIQSRQEEYEQAKKNHDDFMTSFKVRSDELKKELKVKHLVIYSIYNRSYHNLFLVIRKSMTQFVTCKSKLLMMEKLWLI